MEEAGSEIAPATPPFVHIAKDRLNLTRQAGDTVLLQMSPAAMAGSYRLVIDLYSAAAHVHPQGHVGWWAYDPGRHKEHRVRFSRKAGVFSVTLNGRSCEKGSLWVNPSRVDWSREPVLAVHIVLRRVRNNAIAFDDVVHLYQDEEALQSSAEVRKRFEESVPPAGRTVPRWYSWPTGTRAFILTRDLYERDAVGNFAMGLYGLLRANGVACRLGAANFDRQLRGPVYPVGSLLTEIGEEDLVLYNFSTHDPYMEAVSRLPARKILCYHNVTPGRFFQIYDAERAALCDKACSQLHLAGRFDVWLANSEVSARQLASGVATAAGSQSAHPPRAVPSFIAPPLIGMHKWEDIPAEEVQLPDRGDLLLHVGRLAPNKKIEDLFPLFEEYHRLNPNASLVVVGTKLFDGYSNYLTYLLEHKHRRIGKRVHFLGAVTDGQLKTIYGRCSALVVMSEHEGFCIPVTEAMYFGKPVFAYAEPAVRETLGQTGRLFYRKDFPAIAGEISALLRDGRLLESIVAGQARRLEALCERSNGHILWEAIEKVLFNRENTL